MTFVNRLVSTAAITAKCDAIIEKNYASPCRDSAVIAAWIAVIYKSIILLVVIETTIEGADCFYSDQCNRY